MSEDPVGAAGAFLRACRLGDERSAAAAEQVLADISPDVLADALESHEARIAFWLNVYNAAGQRLLEGDLGSNGRRARAFRRPVVTVAGHPLSLDAIEHGLLRRSSWKLGLGYLGNPRPHPFERRFRVAAVDPRIHFALNCAAASCPPILAYSVERLDFQLDLATRGYLAATVQQHAGRMIVPRVFLWFMGDFSGRAGIRRFLRTHGVDPETRRIRFAPWDWTAAPGAWDPASRDWVDVPPSPDPTGPTAPLSGVPQDGHRPPAVSPGPDTPGVLDRDLR